MINKVVVKKKDGTMIKGTTGDFTPNKESFHLVIHRSSDVKKIFANDLKAVFFVKKLEGNKDLHDHLKNNPPRPRKTIGKFVNIIFRDGEIIEGYSHSMHFDKIGFFVSPVELMGNNDRIFVILSFVESILVDGKAVDFVDTTRNKRVCHKCKQAMENAWTHCPFDGTELKSPGG